MHISEGVLSGPVLLSGAAIAGLGTAIGLKKMPSRKVPEVALLSSAFFVASLVRVPLGPANVHLILNSLIGLILGWMAFPSILVALFFQAIIFQYGGLTVLGVNTTVMAVPAVVVFYLFNPLIKRNNKIAYVSAFLAGVVGVGGGAFLLSLSLYLTGEEFLTVSKLALLSHLPVAVVEGIVNSFCIAFIKKVKPEILET